MSHPRPEHAPSVTCHKIVIKPNQSFLNLDWKLFWEYRDMLIFLVRRDFFSKYKQTVLGPAWFVVQPVLTTLVFTVIFGKVANIPTDGVPQPLFYFGGLLAWNYFSQTFQAASNTLIGNANIYKKVFFPRLIIPASSALSNLLAFAVQLLTFSAFWLYFKYFTDAGSSFHLSLSVCLFPLILLQSAAIALGTGLWMSTITAKYRDLHHLTQFLIQIWMYTTPIIYPLSSVPERWQWLVNLNPVAAMVEATRAMLLGTPMPHPVFILQSLAITLIIFFSGLIVFNRAQRTFVDYA